MKPASIVRYFIILFVASIAFSSSVASIPIFAQTATATLVGRTIDEANAALSEVNITLTQTTTGQQRTVSSDSSGDFVFL